jgi:hypothetical protein
MDKLKGSGFNGNMFSMKDLEGLSSDEMAAKMGGGGGGKFGSSKNKRSKKSSGGEFKEPKRKLKTPKWRGASDDEFIQEDNIEL